MLSYLRSLLLLVPFYFASSSYTHVPTKPSEEGPTRNTGGSSITTFTDDDLITLMGLNTSVDLDSNPNALAFCDGITNAAAKCKYCNAKKLPAVNGLAAATREDWWASQTTLNPKIVELLFSSTYAEVGGQKPAAILGYMETVFNRAVATNTPLEKLLRSEYYPAATIAKLDTPVTGKLRPIMDNALKNILAGSNITNFATDNASADVAANRKNAKNPGVEINGELFYVNKNGSGDGSGGVPAHANFAEVSAQSSVCAI